MLRKSLNKMCENDETTHEKQRKSDGKKGNENLIYGRGLPMMKRLNYSN